LRKKYIIRPIEKIHFLHFLPTQAHSCAACQIIITAIVELKNEILIFFL